MQHAFDPIPHVGDADTDVVDLAVVVAAFLAGEDLERLVLRSDGSQALLREGERDLLVALAVKEEERTPDLLHHSVQPEAFQSSPVSTASTPAAARAAEVSIAVIRPRAIVAPTIARWVIPGRLISAE